MNKKKWIAILAGAALAGSLLTAMPVSALYQITAEVPDGYEQFEDGGSLDFVSKNGYYPVYKSVFNANRVLVLTDYHCNVVELEVPTTPENMVSKYETIKEKYADVVDTFDQYWQELSDGVLHITMCDTVDENGKQIQDPSMITSKRGEMQRMCQELLEAGAVTSASYTPYYAVLNLGDYQDFLYLKQVSQTEEVITAFVQQQFGEDKIVGQIDDTDGYYYIKGFKNADALFAASTILEKQFEGARAVPVAIFLLADEQTYTTKTVNLLTAADACGDVDNDGNVSVEDAVAVLTYYAQQSAGLEAMLTQAADTEESAFLSADVDGDGQITVEDAVAILTYYAKKSAGLDAAW